jgi:hypothetical protein
VKHIKKRAERDALAPTFGESQAALPQIFGQLPQPGVTKADNKSHIFKIRVELLFILSVPFFYQRSIWLFVEA